MGLSANLVGCAVFNAQCTRSSSHIDAKRPPRERRLKDSLSQIACEKETVRVVPNECRYEAQLRHAYILSLIHDDKIKRSVAAAVRKVLSRLGKRTRDSDEPLVGESRSYTLEDRPQQRPLL